MIEYYNHEGTTDGASFTPWTSRSEWQRGLFRTDSIIEMFNGIKPTDDPGEIANNNFPGEDYGTEKNSDNDRIDAMRQFGQSDLGGEYILKYVSDTCTLGVQSWGTYKGGYTANYRRNLFVRGLEIEPNTSYRLTFFVKARNHRALPVTDSYNNTPRMSAGVFRGYYKSEKPFSMGVQNDPDHNKFNTQFEYTKDDFNGEWEKVTYMTYYLNDSVANDFVFADGYWWANDNSWTWAADAEGNTTGHDLNYIVQPDKYFVRLGFISDYTTFLVDNLSLTKSTIAGAEYYRDKLRVDFGYKTNMSDIVKKAKAETNIGAAEIKYDDAAEWLKDSLNYEDRFEVWGYKDGEWEPVYIRSAEYHEDGYMYMFTDYEVNPVSGDLEPLLFNDYDSVLVTFHNPIDIEGLTLKYTGTGRDLANAFPNALDTNWIKNGKIIPDFYNEIATPNPYAFEGVHSLDDLPPVFQGAEIPNGSIFLTPQPSFKFKFSRDVWCETFAAGEDLRNTDKAVATVNEVPWKVEYDSDIDSLVITCPDDSWQTMNGDYVIKLIQLKGKGTEYGANVTFSYNFGTPSRTVSAEATPIDISWTLDGENGSVAKGVYTWSANNKTIGDGIHMLNPQTGADDLGNLNRMFVHELEGSGIQRGYEVRPHGAGNGGHVYLGAGDENYKIHLTPGGYKFSFKGTGWSWNNGDLQPATVYVFKRADDPTKVSADDKMEIGVYNATTKSDDALLQDSTYVIPVENVDAVEYSFTVSEDADYIIEFNNKAGAWSQGVFVGDFQLGSVPSTVLYVNNLNEALANAQDRIDLADVDATLYGGAEYDALSDKIEYYKIGGAFDALLETSPTAWNNAKKELDDASAELADRMSKVDLLVPELATLNAAYEDFASTDDENLDEYKAIAAAAELYADVDYTAMTVDSIVKATDNFKALVKALNDHRAKIDDFVSLLASVDEQLGNDAYADFAEFQAMDSVYTVYENYDVYNNSLADLNAAYSALQASLDAWNGKFNSKGIYEMQIDGIAKLVEDLQGSIPEGVKNLDVLLDDKLGFYMLYAKKALYEAILDDPAIDSIDVSDAFVTNGKLYTTVVMSQLGVVDGNTQRGIMNTTVGGAPLDLDFFPGWKYTHKKGNPYIGNGTSWQNGSPSTDGKPKDTFVNLDWNTGFVIEQDIENLPAGNYTLGVGYKIQNTANDGHMIVYNLSDDSVLADSLLNKFTSGSATGGADVNHYLDFESKEGVRLWINPSCGNNGWGSFDNITLQFIKAAEEFNYETALDEVEAAITEKLKATAVIPAKAVKGVKYYDVNGVELKAPKAGLNIIVVDGVATKVLVK